MFYDFILLTTSLEKGLCEDEYRTEGHQNEQVNDYGSIKIDTTEINLLGTVGLRDECFESTIHALDDIKCDRP